MRLRGALDLLHLDQRLVAHARRGIGSIDRAPLVIDLGRVHATVREVGVVRDREEFVAGLTLSVHPVPQIHGLDRVQSAERHRGHLGAVLEEDVAVKVHIVRHRRPLVGAKGRELPWFVGLVGELAVLLPDRLGDLRGHQRLVGRLCAQQLDGIQIDPLRLGRGVGLQDQRLSGGQLTDRRLGIVCELDHADVFRVVGDARKVERRVDLHLVTEWVLDGLALEILVGVRRIGQAITEQPSVERPACVDVRFTEVGVAIGVFLLRKCRCGQRRQRQCRAQSRGPLMK